MKVGGQGVPGAFWCLRARGSLGGGAGFGRGIHVLREREWRIRGTGLDEGGEGAYQARTEFGARPLAVPVCFTEDGRDRSPRQRDEE
ncbi:hypothetical protein NBRC116586_23350 [Pseudooceanicola nitratireducens]